MKEQVIMITEPNLPKLHVWWKELVKGKIGATITKLKVKEGDYVEKDQDILEFKLGYSLVAVPSPISGKVVSITAKVGELVEPGAVVGIVDNTSIEQAKEREKFLDYDEAIEIYEKLELSEEAARVRKIVAEQKKADHIERAKEREKYLDYDKAIEIYEKLELPEEAARVRKMQAEMGSVKVAQNVVQGDQITKTEIKDSVLNRSNIGSGGDDKFTKLKELKEMLTEGLIDDDEFKQMKKEILGK